MTHATVLTHFLVPASDNVRHAIEEKPLEALIESLRLLGQLVPVITYPDPERQGYQKIVDGHRRHAAMLRAGITEVKCVILPDKPDDFTLLTVRATLGNTSETLTHLENADIAQKIKLARPELPWCEIARMMGIHKVKLSKCLTVSEDGSPLLHASVVSGEVPSSVASGIARLKDMHAEQDRLIELYKGGFLKRDSVEDEVSKLLGKKVKPVIKSFKLRIGGLSFEYVGDKVEGLLADLAALVEKVKRNAKPSDSIEALPVLLKRGA